MFSSEVRGLQTHTRELDNTIAVSYVISGVGEGISGVSEGISGVGEGISEVSEGISGVGEGISGGYYLGV